MEANVRAHTNIALIKYWGKDNQTLKTPLMSSLSMTLDAFYTDTKVIHDPSLTKNRFYLNDVEQDAEHSKRVFNYISRLQEMFKVNDHFEIHSYNHVPTAAGLASSASAFAALAGAFAKSYNLDLAMPQLSRLARLGSGSATRSVYGGFVKWIKGDDITSIAIPINEHPDWDLHMLAVEINTGEKKISSSKGMLHAQTSPFYQPWLDRNDLEINELEVAIKNKDFSKLGELAELSANEMHSTNLTATPSFTYFEPATIKLIHLVHNLRKQGIECYYTIDAGPNVKILTQEKNINSISSAVHNLLGNVKIVDASFGPGLTYLD
ncbi:diphosphomevalonate decarboxylase [Lactobacillus sp. PV034]|uniref:diphosphomevalonate decarboxylase n=1 Tax=Lactobacillus sp. PV034 TaxID=2594495 RepID=UPI0022404556|nr:diphosphomevalonate decarboxylase [Lactobacillus sp. PV034]QNQ80403.1 diphosphomevalonate decarboxylase [Lactobacillus sp. PV034]